MKNSTGATLITNTQRVVDQLVLENLNGLRIKRESAIQESIRRDKNLVIDYLRRKLPHAHIDISVIDRMESNEFNRVLKKVNIRRLFIVGLNSLWPLISIFGIFLAFWTKPGMTSSVNIFLFISSLISFLLSVLCTFLRSKARYSRW